MKIVSTFLMSEKFESNLLEIKLNCESNGVEEWILIESDFSFRGDIKGCYAKEVLKESRFDKFRDRVKIISIEDNLFEKLCNGRCEKEYFKVEFASRAACWDYIRTKYNDDTKVIVGDVDESVDLSNKNRLDEFWNICKENESGFQLDQPKMWWDIDNFSPYPKFIPVHSVKSLDRGWTSFTHRNNDCKTIQTKNILAFEYAYSFGLSDNFRKCSTFAHDRYDIECIEQAFKFNSWHKTSKRNERLGESIYDWFETVELNEYNAPSFVLDNFKRLKVGNIDPNYAENRVNLLGLAPHPCRDYNLMRGFKINKQYDYLRK